MEKRNIDRLSMIRVLRIGEIEGGVTAGEGPGEWKCKITGRTTSISSRREIGVVVVVKIKPAKVFVKTVEWEDL